MIAPASSAKIERVDLGMSAIRSLGYAVVEGRHLRGRSPQYFSGTVAERLEDFHTAFTDSSVDAVVCSRGGYGSNYLLEHIDLGLVRANPKPFFAYSDMTVLQNWLLDRTGLVSFHGPMVAADFHRQDGVESRKFRLDHERWHGQCSVSQKVCARFVQAKRRGVLYGGCLSMLVSALGTPFAADTEGKLLFLEDVSAKPYQIDRMLRQLILAGKLDGVKGIIFGEMPGLRSAGNRRRNVGCDDFASIGLVRRTDRDRLAIWTCVTGRM